PISTVTASFVNGTYDFIPPLTGFNFPSTTFPDHARIVGNAYLGSNDGSTAMTWSHVYRIGTFRLTASSYWAVGSTPNFNLQDLVVANKTTTAANVWIGTDPSVTSFSVSGTGDGRRSLSVSCSMTLNPCTVSASASATPVTCNGGNDGTATVTA